MTTAWRLLIGPYFTQYPWYSHTTGTVVDLAYATTLSSAMTAGSTSNISLASGTSFPTSGGVWVGPVNFGEGWEYVVYSGKSSNTLTGIQRESSTIRDHNGAHASGSSVCVWYPITSDNGELSFTETMDETYSVITWTATISGFKFPQHVMRNNHIAIVQTNDAGAGWANYLIGFVDSPSATGDHTNNSPWSMTIRTVDVLLQAKVKPLRIGGLDLAKEGTATGSTPLVLAYDERATGDFTAAAPAFDASSTIDRNPKTLWIGERFMGHAITYPFPSADGTNDGGQKFNQIYVNPPPGVPNTLKWIELIQTNDTSPLQGIALNCADPTSGGDTYIWLLHSADTAEGDLIILCQDEAVFRQYNPLASPKVIYENYEFFRRMEPEGGELWLRLGELNLWLAHVAWGDKNGGIHHEDAPSPWSGPTVAAPGYDETLRYTHDNTVLANAAAYWEVTKTRTAGYKWNTHPDQYVAIELPGLGLKLTENITASVPGVGDLLKISDSAGPSSSGLPASGTLQDGDEQINYSSKTDEGVIVSARGANSTTAAIHDIDDIIYNVEGGVPSDAHLLSTIAWDRNGGSIVPSRFKMWRSVLQTPRSPEEDDWENDWVQIGTEITGNTAYNYTYAMSPSLRCRHIMITTDLMTVDPARARFNEIYATIDNSAYDTSLWLDNGVTAADVIRQLVINAGLNTAVVIDAGSTSQLYDQTTADDVAWAVITDLAEFAGCRLSVGRDSKITVGDDVFWETFPSSVDYTWGNNNAVDVQPALRNGIGASQVKVTWRTPDSTSKGTEVYPSGTGSGFGQVTETKELIYPNSSAAQTAAKKRYHLARYPYEFTVNTAVNVQYSRPGEVHNVTWQYNRAGLTVTRKCLAKAIEHKLKGGTWLEALHLIQIEREAEY